MAVCGGEGRKIVIAIRRGGGNSKLPYKALCVIEPDGGLAMVSCRIEHHQRVVLPHSPHPGRILILDRVHVHIGEDGAGGAVVDPERPVGGVDGQGLVVGVHVINGFHLPGGQVVELVAVVVASIPADHCPGSMVEDGAVKGGKDFALFGAGQVDELVLAVFRPEAGGAVAAHPVKAVQLFPRYRVGKSGGLGEVTIRVEIQ